MREKKKLGRMLVESGLMTEFQLNQAVLNQKKSHLRLGQYLTREGVVSESQIVDLISRQLRIAKYDTISFPIDVTLAGLLSAETAQKYQMVPIRRENRLLTVAMIDPLDIEALDILENSTGLEAEAIICSEQELNQIMGSLYGTYGGIGDVLEDMEEMQYDTESLDEVAISMEDVEVSSLQDMAEEAPVVRLVNSILSQAVREGASDVHISPEKDFVQVRFRVDGKLHNVPAPPKSMLLHIISRLKILANMDIATSRIPQDGRFTVKLNNKEINIRASTIPTIYGENMVLRLLDTSAGIHTLETLGMADGDRRKIESVMFKPYGMILSTGPTGSGKSTSLYSILKKINQTDINILTVEDPVEYRIEKIRQVQLNRKAGMTFASGLRSILRQDPDVIMVGEIRDRETANIAVQAALTGHRVLSTVHTNDAAGAITRFVDMGIEPFLVASVMLVSFAQRLVRRVCPNCREPYRPSDEALSFWGQSIPEDARFQRGRGCFHCQDTGYRGRIGIYEILLIDDAIRDMIIKNRASHEIARAAQAAGHLRLLKEDAFDKVARGITTIEEAASAVMV